MHFKYVDDREIIYNGQQLRPHWIFEEFNLLGDSIVAFVGECTVKIDHMVDLEDVKDNSPIYSKKMLSFIIEHFGASLEEIVLRQRLFMCIIQDALNKLLNRNAVLRDGDDLYFEGGKLSVSIATISPVSGLIHVGINIDSENAPVNAAGLLSEMNLNNTNDFAIQLLKSYTIEQQQIKNATYKVKPVN